MKKMILSVVLIFTFADSNEVKEAFNSGIRNALKVIKHERSQVYKKIPTGYCISAKNENGIIDDFSAIKLETLSLILGYKPSFIVDNNRHKLLCLEIVDNIDSAKKVLSKMRKSYNKLDKFYPKIVMITDGYHREIPNVGRFNKDMSPTIDALSDRVSELKRKYNSVKEELNKYKSNKYTVSEDEAIHMKEKINDLQSQLQDYKRKFENIRNIITTMQGNKQQVSSDDTAIKKIFKINIKKTDIDNTVKVDKPSQKFKKTIVDSSNPKIIILEN
jgi:archaellum component FlaC